MSKEARPAALMEPVPEMRAALTPMDMLSRAVEQGANMDVLEKLMALHERWEANQARKAFDAALSDAKAELPTIIKNKQVGFESKKAGATRTDYKHETLDEIARTINPILSKHGLQYRFRTSSEVNEPVSVTCIISHRDGHSEENTLRAGRDDSGNKNPIQQIGSTVTYLQRYTLKAALGLAAADDDDGKAAGGPATVSEEQAIALEKRLVAVKADIHKFCQYIGATSIAAIPSTGYESAERAVRVKEKQAAAEKKWEAADAV